MSPNNYTAKQTAIEGVDTVQLADVARKTEVEIAPGVGNMAYKWSVGGRNYLYFPYAGVAAFARQPRLCGVPFLGPWANRLDGDAFWANGKKYLLNPGLGNLRRDGNQKPIHGVLGFSKEWKLGEAKADARMRAARRGMSERVTMRGGARRVAPTKMEISEFKRCSTIVVAFTPHALLRARLEQSSPAR